MQAESLTLYHVNTERRGGEDCLEVELEGERVVGGGERERDSLGRREGLDEWGDVKCEKVHVVFKVVFTF